MPLRAYPAAHRQGAAERRQPTSVPAPGNRVDSLEEPRRIGPEWARVASLVPCVTHRPANGCAGRGPPAAHQRCGRAGVIVVHDLLACARPPAVHAVAVQPFGRCTPFPLAAAPGCKGRQSAGAEGAPLQTSATGERPPLPRDNADHRANRVGPVERALRSPHDFDPLDVGSRQVGEVVAAAERIRLNAVDEHQRVVRFPPARKQGGDRAAPPCGSHSQAGHRPQRIGDVLELSRVELGT